MNQICEKTLKFDKTMTLSGEYTIFRKNENNWKVENDVKNQQENHKKIEINNWNPSTKNSIITEKTRGRRGWFKSKTGSQSARGYLI